MGLLKVAGPQGDKRIAWDPLDIPQVTAARKRFDELVKKSRYLAWRLDDTGKKGEPITEFDPKAGVILVAPPMVGG